MKSFRAAAAQREDVTVAGTAAEDISRGLVEFTRYTLAFAPVEGAAYAADGAVDQYVGGSLRLRYEM